MNRLMFLLIACGLANNLHAKTALYDSAFEDNSYLMELENKLYAIVEFQGHEHVVMILDHSPTCKCYEGNEITER